MANGEETIKKLGFGLMRLPQQDGQIDLPQVCDMVDLFLAHGYTYFDTAWGYNDGDSEIAIGKALVQRYPRDSFQLATKLPAFFAADAASARRMIDTSLQRTGAGYIDYYLLHNLDEFRTSLYEEYGLWDYIKELQQRGLVRHWGFSFHAQAEHLEKLLTEHPDVEFVQLQINYADWENVRIQSRRCYEVARRHGKPIVIMEPVKGGLLAAPPEPVRQLLQQADPSLSPAAWAMRFAASLDGVLTVLSGASNLEQLQENIATMDDFRPLDEAEWQLLAQARQMIAELPLVPCTSCRYCVSDCPENIMIPQLLEILNVYRIYGNLRQSRGSYEWAMTTSGKAGDCLACGQCESVCPQHLDVSEYMRELAELFEV